MKEQGDRVGNFFYKHGWRIFILLLFPWFFIGGPEYESSRVFKEVWNFGHILFFAVFTLEAFRYLETKHLAIQTKHLTIILLVLMLAITIEVCQSLISGRNPSFQDIIFDLVGGFAVLVWKHPTQNPAGRISGIKVLFYGIASICIVICMITFHTHSNR